MWGNSRGVKTKRMGYREPIDHFGLRSKPKQMHSCHRDQLVYRAHHIFLRVTITRIFCPVTNITSLYFFL